jgi:hypothetical protein
MNQHRWEDNNEKFRPKSDRYIYSNNYWYFQTREEGIVGPFVTREDAENRLCQFLMDLLESNHICPI